MASATLDRVTVDEFMARCDADDFELIDGELRERTMGMEAAWVSATFYKFIAIWNDAARLGLAVADGAPLQIFGDHYAPKPDGLYISKVRLPSARPPVGTLTVPPELVIEVVSPSDNAYAVNRKVRRYLEVGIDLVWVAYPETRSVHVFRADGTTAVVAPPGELSGESILPGFSRPVSDFFPDPD